MQKRLLEDKIAIVTGSRKGIGKSIVEKFAEDGAIVFANAHRGNIDEWAEETGKKYKTQVHPIYFDITDFKAVKDSILYIKRKYGRIDILVNNAGIVTYEFLGLIDFDKLREMLEVNVVSLINITQVVSRLMFRQKEGSIINISSIVGEQGAKGQLSYSATKGAVSSITKSAAKELAEYNIRVNAIAPGMIATDRLKSVMEDKFEDKINDIGFKRLGSPEEVANIISFLASSRSEYITGQIIGVDGCFII